MQRMTWTWTEEEEEEEVDNFEGAAGKAIVPSRGGREGELVTTVSLFLSRIRTGRRRRSGVTKVGPRIKFVYFTSYVRSMVFVLWSGTFRPRLASRGCRAAATVWPSAIARRSYW